MQDQDNDNSKQGGPRPYASSPCYMHEVDPAYIGLPAAEDAQSSLPPGSNVKQWRKDERQRLIADRRTIPVATRRNHETKIIQQVEHAMGDVAGRIVSAYWPIRGEPDLRGCLERVITHGGRAALPVVITPGAPLIFRIWSPGDPMDIGVWNIPIPKETSETVVPDIVLSPVVGFDSRCYRLGYGGGFFDRTFAALAAQDKHPQVIGIGYQQALIPTIHPQHHDIAMNFIITETGRTDAAER